jgi:predicted nucleotidyltransferase component of viral defense system
VDKLNPYFRQVELLVRVLPVVSKSSCFALKGGTAINLFFRDMPRLSVDIDLVYVPIKDRKISLGKMTSELQKIGSTIGKLLPQARIQFSRLHQSEFITRILIEADRAIIKIEVSPVLRGTVYKPEVKRIGRTVEDTFGFAEMSVVSFEDLYAGKILAALDRQHPRDLFDIKGLLDNEGISAKLKEAFMVYLISHNRRILEILNPSLLDIEQIFKTDFEGMTTAPVKIGELIRARSDLVKMMNSVLSDSDKEFLLEFKKGNPDWSFFNMPHIKDLPAVKWKLHNLNQMPGNERLHMVDALKTYFGM